ncbi:MAG TPA: SDR family NAD(P)-dependent oxidoreductase [Thermodesulfobacteriota bacterium]|nr:SDR family NAD(P)-dependent oxidoreductase [Thermodesulfobacteriota bacterium]
MFSLTNKTAAVSGAGSGIGRAVALELSKAGARVCVSDVKLQSAEDTAAAIAAAGGEATAMRLDVTRKADAENAVARVVRQWGRLDVWVNNAGVSTMNRFLDLTEEEWDFNLGVNAKGTFFCTQAAGRQMSAQEPEKKSGLRGKIINIASMAGRRGNAPLLAHYVASKFAVVGLTQAAAGELAAFGITVNSVCPGYVRPSMQEREVGWEARLRSLSEEEVRRLYVADTPLRRLETPEDVARVVLFLASPAADFMTGAAIHVNGGAWME